MAATSRGVHIFDGAHPMKGSGGGVNGNAGRQYRANPHPYGRNVNRGDRIWNENQRNVRAGQRGATRDSAL